MVGAAAVLPLPPPPAVTASWLNITPRAKALNGVLISLGCCAGLGDGERCTL